MAGHAAGPFLSALGLPSPIALAAPIAPQGPLQTSDGTRPDSDTTAPRSHSRTADDWREAAQSGLSWESVEWQVASLPPAAPMSAPGAPAQRKIRWIPDSEAPACMSCAKDFGLGRRRHHCRLCGHVVCGTCSGNSVKLTQKGVSKVIRVCDECFVSFQTEAGGGAAQQQPQVGTRGGLNGDARSTSAGVAPVTTAAGVKQRKVARVPVPVEQTPAEALLGVRTTTTVHPALEPSSTTLPPRKGSSEDVHGYNLASESYQNDEEPATGEEQAPPPSTVSPNAHRQLYQSPLLAEKPDSGLCCRGCVIC